MRKTWLASVALLLCCGPAKAIYGPSLIRADLPIALQACQDARFTEGQQIINALQSRDPGQIADVLGDALQELHATPASSTFYAARAFCIHELVPSRLPHQGPLSVARAHPPAVLSRFREIGIDYFYYDPDAQWVVRKDPVDLSGLATEHLDSRWGRTAFLMMTRLGWSQGDCQEGPDQFRAVIARGQAFLNSYPQSEVSNDVRLEIAHADETWWNLSRRRTDGSKSYKAGADAARRNAIELYQTYLEQHSVAAPGARDRLRALQENPEGSDHYDYFCPNYED